jgi:dolichol-phosphate mannosyltransferase
MRRPLVSLIIPVLDEEENAERAYRAVASEIERLTAEYEFEIIFTDNHSRDRTPEILREICQSDPRVRVIRFSRNFGYQRSLFVGYLNAAGACAIQLDCDLQDPPSLIPEMLEAWRAGYAVVYGVRRSRQEGWLITCLRRVFYRTIAALSEDDLPADAGDFRLVDRRVLDELHLVDDATPYLRGLFSSLGFRQIGIPYDRAARAAGRSKFSFAKLVQLSLDGVVNHSLIPLRVASLTGLLVALGTLGAIGVYFVGRLVFGQDWPAGFATTTMLILLSITLNATFLGIIGEYLGRIYQQTKRRPLAVIEQTVNVAEVQLGATGGRTPRLTARDVAEPAAPPARPLGQRRQA